MSVFPKKSHSPCTLFTTSMFYCLHALYLQGRLFSGEQSGFLHEVLRVELSNNFKPCSFTDFKGRVRL